MGKFNKTSRDIWKRSITSSSPSRPWATGSRTSHPSSSFGLISDGEADRGEGNTSELIFINLFFV